MRRVMLAFAGLLGVSVAAAPADYFLIRINLGPGKTAKATQQQGGFGGKMGPFGGGMGPNSGSGPSMTIGPGGGGPGGQGGPPPGAMQMMQRMRGMGGPNQGQQAQKEDDEDIYDPNSLHTDVIIEVRKYDFPTSRGQKIPGVMRIHHKWGKSWLTINDTFIAIKQIKRKPVREQFNLLQLRRKAEKTADDWIELARWALEHGLMKEVRTSMDSAKQLDPNNATVKVYEQMHAAMAKPATGANAAEFWQGKLTDYQVEQGAHYTVLYHAKSLKPEEMKPWMEELEHNYEAFFDWFALHGKAVPVPTSRLMVILADDAATFELLHDGLGVTNMEADAFLARRDNLAVLATTPQEKAYIALSKSSDALWNDKGYSMSDLLKAKGRREASAEENEDAQMRALALTAMRERSRVTSVSSEGTRQLAAAIGLLPREVKVPQWFQFGLGSFFETPHNAYWEGTGAASWTYLDLWKKWNQKDKLDKPEKAFRDVVTDAYFKLPKTKPEKALLKARTMSWALTYYLMERHLDGVFRFCAELNNLPRDMDLDPNLVMACFSRAFHLGDNEHPERPTTARLVEFSGDWYRFLKNKPLPCPDAGKSLDDVLTQKSNGNSGKGRPNGPGFGPGFPGAGGPGNKRGRR